MKASELIERLQALIAEHGDLDVMSYEVADDDLYSATAPVTAVDLWSGRRAFVVTT